MDQGQCQTYRMQQSEGQGPLELIFALQGQSQTYRRKHLVLRGQN